MTREELTVAHVVAVCHVRWCEECAVEYDAVYYFCRLAQLGLNIYFATQQCSTHESRVEGGKPQGLAMFSSEVELDGQLFGAILRAERLADATEFHRQPAIRSCTQAPRASYRTLTICRSEYASSSSSESCNQTVDV